MLMNWLFGIFKKHETTHIRIILGIGAIKAMYISLMASELAWVLKSGTTRGSFVLLKNTAQMNQRMTMLVNSKVHLMCLGDNMLVTNIKLSKWLPCMTMLLSL